MNSWIGQRHLEGVPGRADHCRRFSITSLGFAARADCRVEDDARPRHSWRAILGGGESPLGPSIGLNLSKGEELCEAQLREIRERSHADLIPGGSEANV